MPYDAYIFDLYGTLIDIRTDEAAPRVWNALKRALEVYGTAARPRDLKAAYAAALSSLAASHGPTFEPDIGDVFASLLRTHGAVPNEDAIKSIAWQFRTASTTHLRCYAGAKTLLDALRKRAKVLLLSNAQRLFTVPELERLDLLSRFDEIFLSSDYGCKKPDPAFFCAALESHGLDPKRCLMIGNDPVCDIAAARNVGMDAYYIRSALSPRHAPPAVYGVPSQAGMDLARLCRTLCRD